MHYRLSLLSIQSAQPLLRSDNLGSSQLLVSRKNTRFVSRYAWTWRETLLCLLIMFRQTIFVIINEKHLYIRAPYVCVSYRIARDSVEGKYNTIHQYSISTATIEMRVFL